MKLNVKKIESVATTSNLEGTWKEAKAQCF